MEMKLQKNLFNCVRAYLEAYKCPQCISFRTNLLHLLYRHVKEDHSEQDEHCHLYSCQKCSFETWSRFLAVKHRKLDCCLEKSQIGFRHDHCYYKRNHKGIVANFSVKWLICWSCSYRTKDRLKFLLHQNRQNCKKMLLKRMQCRYCPFETSYRKCLTKHEYFQHVIKLLQREDTAKHVSNLLKHQSNNSREVEPHFALSYKQFAEQRFQVASKKDKTWFVCLSCPFRTKSEKYLKKHFDITHLRRMPPKQVRQWFQCGKCSFKSGTMKELRQHQTCYNKHDPERGNVVYIKDHIEEMSVPKFFEIRWFQCGQCPHKSQTLRHLKMHQKREHYL